MTDQYNYDESMYGGDGSQSRATAIISDRTKTFVISILVALNVLATIVMVLEWRIAERESRLLEYYVMELDGKMMASGLLKPPDSWSGKHKE